MHGGDRTTRGLELAILLSAPAVALAAGLDSYSSLVDVARGLGGYGQLEAHVYPLTIDLTLAGSIAASFLLTRWCAPGGPRAVIALLVLGSAVLTVSGNALHGWLVAGNASAPWALRAAVSAVPGAAIVGVTHQVVLVLRHRPRPASVEARVSAEPESAPRPPATRSPRSRARQNGSPKLARVRALLEEHGLASLDPQARAELIGAVARETRTSAQYVRRIAREFRDPGAPEARGEEVAA